MSAARVVTATVDAYLIQGFGPEYLRKSDDEVINSLVFYQGDCIPDSWVLVGNAQITVALINTDAVNEKLVKCWRAEQTEIRGNAEARFVALEAKIQNLLAISMDPPARAAGWSSEDEISF